MITRPRLRARTVSAAVVTALLSLAVGAAPALAADPMPGSANDTVMSTGQALLVFIGIPVVVAAVIWLLVLAPGWTRGGRPSSADAWTTDPVVVGSVERAPEAPALEADATAEDDAAPGGTGGTSATW